MNTDKNGFCMFFARSSPRITQRTIRVHLRSSVFICVPAFLSLPRFADPVASELPGDPPAAEAALERPQQRRLARLIGGLAAQRGDPVVGDLQVLRLVERIEREPQPEALRERDLLFRGLP